MMRPKSRPQAEPAPDAVLTKALLRAADLLGLSSRVLARILGVSEASVSRLASGARTIDPASKEGELALLLVRVYRSLDALVGRVVRKAHGRDDVLRFHAAPEFLRQDLQAAFEPVGLPGRHAGARIASR